VSFAGDLSPDLTALFVPAEAAVRPIVAVPALTGVTIQPVSIAAMKAILLMA